MSIPKVDAAIIGGSGTWGARFPEDFNLGLEVCEYLPSQDTPHGESAPFKILSYKDHRIIYVAMHGCYPNKEESILPPWASKQVAWIFHQAGAKWILTGGSVGGIQTATGTDLPPWSIVIPSDFFMWQPPVVPINHNGRVKRTPRSVFYRVAGAFCPILGRQLYQAATKQTEARIVQKGGIYTCTPWGRFETPSEISAMKQLGHTVVGQTVGWEAIAARQEGIPIASLNIVSNYAEENNRWCGSTASAMTDFYWECPPLVAKITADAAKSIFDEEIKPSSLDQYRLTGLEQFPVPEA